MAPSNSDTFLDTNYYVYNTISPGLHFVTQNIIYSSSINSLSASNTYMASEVAIFGLHYMLFIWHQAMIFQTNAVFSLSTQKEQNSMEIFIFLCYQQN